MPIRALERIRHSGRIYTAGDIIHNLTDGEKERLIELKSAEVVETFSEVTNAVQEIDVDPELFKELKKDLDENFNADDLKREAKNVGVEFDSKDTKDKVMEAIIKQGKVDLLLEEDE